MHLLDSGNPRWIFAPFRMERRQKVGRKMHFRRGHGLRLSRLPVLCDYYISRASHCGLLRSHLQGRSQAGYTFI